MLINRPEIKRYFEDLKVGDKHISSPRRITGDEMLEFARKYDPQWFHADAQAAKHSSFGGLIASGIFTAAIWRQLDHEINGDVAFVCGFGWDDVRWPVPVRPGDELHATSEVLDTRPSRSRTDRGHATFLYQVINQRGEVVLSFRSLNLVHCRDGAPDNKSQT